MQPIVAFIADVLPLDPVKWITDPSKIGVVALLLVAILAFYRRWVVPGWLYDAVLKERDSLRSASDALLRSYQDREREERLWRLERLMATTPPQKGDTP